MRLALVCALVLITTNVLNERSFIAVRAASAQDGIERVERFSGELGNGELAE